MPSIVTDTVADGNRRERLTCATPVGNRWRGLPLRLAPPGPTMTVWRRFSLDCPHGSQVNVNT
jgi:hypothetical protein